MNPEFLPGPLLGALQGQTAHRAIPQGDLVADQLPKAPPRRPRVNMFDRDHRADTLFALGTGLMSGSNFSESLANAAGNLRDARAGYIREMTPQRELGGPDNAFEITTDPVTHERSYREIPEFQAYRQHRREEQRNPRDTQALRGSVMGAVLRMPPEQRAAAYAQLLEDSRSLYGDLGLPATWDDLTGRAISEASITPTERLQTDFRNRQQDYRERDGDRRFGLQSENVHSTISTREAASARAAARGRSAPPSTRRRGAASPPPGFILD